MPPDTIRNLNGGEGFTPVTDDDTDEDYPDGECCEDCCNHPED